MKFAVLQFFSWPERRVPLTTVYERALARVRIMDNSGFDAVWLAEHHFSSYSVCPSVHLMGMHVADITTNLRIGTGVSLAAFYHPLRLAEEVALLDVLSGGRVNWGAGRGFDRKEFEAFGVAGDDSYPRFREHFDIVLQAWRSERLTYHGQFHDFNDVEVLPKPLQAPHPPVWVASSSPDAVQWAAEQGHAILMDPHSSHGDIGSKFRLYEETLAAGGHQHDQDTPIARLMAIAKTDAEAEEIARAGAGWTVGSYANRDKSIGPGPRLKQQPVPRDDPVERYLGDVIIHGSPARVIDQLKALEETIPLNYLLASPLSHETFLLLAEEVVPALS